MPEPSARRRHRRPVRAGVGGVVVIAVAAGVTLWATGASGSSGYRTATATRATVRQTVGLSGTVEPVHAGKAAFQVAGTVSKVDVAPGQQVTAGQTLASLATTALDQNVTAAQTLLAAAQATLAENEAGQAASTSTGSSASAAAASTRAAVSGTGTGLVLADVVTPSSAGTGAGKKPPGGGGGTGSSSLQKAQQAVVAAQHIADLDSQKAAAALAQAETTCAATAASTTSTTSTTASTTTTTTTTTVPVTTTSSSSTTLPAVAPSTTTVPVTTSSSAPASASRPSRAPHPPPTTTTTVGTPPPTAPATSNGSAACATGLGLALADQQQVSSDQQAVSVAESALAKILATSAAKTSRTPTGSGGSSSGSGGSTRTKSSTGGTSAKSSGTSAGSGTTAAAAANSPEQLASDQAAIDSDQATLIDAQQSLAEAQLTSPIAGEVASVGLTAGQSVTAGSATAAITVVNSGSFEVTASLTSTQVAEVKVGDQVLISVDGTTGTLTGTASQVGPVDATSSSYTYPLVVALAPGSHGIAAGSTAQLQVIIQQVTYALAVPTSAVHTAAVGDSYVMVLKSGRETRTLVTVGAVGGTYTQITKGLGVGAAVVLADLSQAIPASSTATAGRFGAGLGAGGGAFARRAAAAG